MTHRNRWFTVLKNGWIFPWLCKRLPEGTYTYSASSITGNSARSSECQANLIFRGSSFCQVKVYIPKTAPTSRYLNDLLYTPSCCWYHIPSGKLTSLWKITTFNGKTHYKLPFSIAMLVYQRVYSHQNIPFCWDPPNIDNFGLKNRSMFVPIFHQHRHVRLDIHIGLSVCTICWSTHVRHPCLMVQPNFFVMVRPTFLKFKTQLWHTFTGWWCNNHLEKYEILKNNGVHQWEGSHPIYEMENKNMFQTTNQLTYFRYISMGTSPWPDLLLGCSSSPSETRRFVLADAPGAWRNATRPRDPAWCWWTWIFHIPNGGSFHCFLYVYQRVNLHFPMVFLWLTVIPL